MEEPSHIVQFLGKPCSLSVSYVITVHYDRYDAYKHFIMVPYWLCKAAKTT